MFQRPCDRLVHDLQDASARECLELNQCQLRFHAGGIAIHHESYRAGGSQDRYLAVAKSMLRAHFQRVFPCPDRAGEQTVRDAHGVNAEGLFAMGPDHPEHRRPVVLEFSERRRVLQPAVLTGDRPRLS